MTFILNLIVGAALSYQENVFVRGIVNLAISTCLVLFGWYLHHNDGESAYKRDWEATYTKVAQDEQTQSMKLQDTLPTSLQQPCEPLQEIADTSTKSNLLWQIDTISKYNRCAASYDALLLIYETLRKAQK